MKLLCLHCDYVAYKPLKKALKNAAALSEEEKAGGRYENCLLVFSTLEKGDDEAVVKKAAQEVRKHYGEVKAASVLVYPYAHLSANLASPDDAVRLLKAFHNAVKEFCPEAGKSVFGYYKEFELKCKGHPLAELSKTITSEPVANVPYLQPKLETTKPRMLLFLAESQHEDNLNENEKLRNSAALLLAMAFKKQHSECKRGEFGITEDGFYYDFDTNKPVSPIDLAGIEKGMQNILNKQLTKKIVSRKQALELFSNLGETYKTELINETPEDAKIRVYTCDGFTELYNGRAIENLSEIKAVKLTKVSGAYWKGNSKNKQMQRIYGVAFSTQTKLNEYITFIEEAEKRDHRKIGKELELFMIEEAGAGFPFFLPNGVAIRNELENYLREKLVEADYKEIRTPIILDEELWKQSGHWDHYKNSMYFTEIDGKAHAIKPMNCPGAILIYKKQPKSYRELPLRLSEFGLVHRHELSGVLSGLFRVRAFTQDDAHLFVLPEQVEEEVNKLIDLTTSTYRLFGFEYEIELSTRPEKFMGDLKVWDNAEESLKNALDSRKINYKINDGDGAFYGPKIDFKIKDSLKRQWQLGTIQADFQMPERFDLHYDANDGSKHRPVMLHRTILGSFERFLGILIEHYGGAFPTWLSPVQVIVLPITDSQNTYSKGIVKLLKKEGIRTELDDSQNPVNKKIRDAQLRKISYMIIIGKKEMENGTISIRQRNGLVTPDVSTSQFVEKIVTEIKERRMS
ncbi:MAG: threonine--tRNA ligase [Candidatus Micrarchaeia archaeon]